MKRKPDFKIVIEYPDYTTLVSCVSLPSADADTVRARGLEAGELTSNVYEFRIEDAVLIPRQWGGMTSCFMYRIKNYEKINVSACNPPE